MTPHLAHLASPSKNTDEQDNLPVKINESCTDKKCLEDTYGPNAVEMILAMFTMADIDLPPHLAHLANQIENIPHSSEDPTEVLPLKFMSFPKTEQKKE